MEVTGSAAVDSAWPGSQSGRGIQDESQHCAMTSFRGVGDGGEEVAGRSALAGSGALGGGPAAQDRGDEGAVAAVVVAAAASTRRQDSEGESTGGSSIRGVVGAGEEDAAQCQGRVAGSEVAAGPTAGNLAWPPLRGMGGAGGGGGGAWGGELMADDWI